MSIVDTTLTELAPLFQLSALSFNRDGVAALRLGDRERIFFEKQARGAGVMLCVVRALPPHHRGIAEKALRLCGAEGGYSRPVRPGLTRDNELVLMTLFTERDFILSNVAPCIARLRDMQSGLTGPS
jgi:type III secretion system chaperone SycN